MNDPLDVLVRIRAVAGNGMLSAKQRLDTIEALMTECRALLAKTAEAEERESGSVGRVRTAISEDRERPRRRGGAE